MKNLCENCNLYYQIEECRKKLNNLIAEKEMNFLDDKVIQLSQLLDELVYRCVFCENPLPPRNHCIFIASLLQHSWHVETVILMTRCWENDK